MIKVTRLNGQGLVLNAEAVLTVEATPDTVITLVGNKCYVVLEGVDEIIKRIISYRGAVLAMVPFYSSHKLPL